MASSDSVIITSPYYQMPDLNALNENKPYVAGGLVSVILLITLVILAKYGYLQKAWHATKIAFQKSVSWIKNDVLVPFRTFLNAKFPLHGWEIMIGTALICLMVTILIYERKHLFQAQQNTQNEAIILNDE